MSDSASSSEPTKPAAEGAAKPAHAAAKPPAVMAATAWSDAVTELLAGNFPEAILRFESYRGQNFLTLRNAADVPAIVEFLKLEADYDFLTDLTAVDYPQRAERFELVYILYSFSRNERVRIKAGIAEGAAPPTLTGVFPAANWMEREVFDMFGIEFAGHPDLRRLLMPEGWQGYPLRRDYGILQMDNAWVQTNLGIESGQ